MFPPPPVRKHFLANTLVAKEPLGQLAVSGIVKTLHAAENQNKQGRSCTRGHSFDATISFSLFCLGFTQLWTSVSRFKAPINRFQIDSTNIIGMIFFFEIISDVCTLRFKTFMCRHRVSGVVSTGTQVNIGTCRSISSRQQSNNNQVTAFHVSLL